VDLRASGDGRRASLVPDQREQQDAVAWRADGVLPVRVGRGGRRRAADLDSHAGQTLTSHRGHSTGDLRLLGEGRAAHGQREQQAHSECSESTNDFLFHELLRLPHSTGLRMDCRPSLAITSRYVTSTTLRALSPALNRGDVRAVNSPWRFLLMSGRGWSVFMSSSAPNSASSMPTCVTTAFKPGCNR